MTPSRRTFCVLFGCCLLVTCQTDPSAVNEIRSSSAWFHDQRQALNVDFQHMDGRSGRRYYVETVASGGGWFDYDADGDPDLYLINGAPTPGSSEGRATSNALYENRNGTFVDVTAQTELGDQGYGMGMCVGDVNGDGLLDLFLTNFGPDALYLNRGDGTFAEVGKSSGVDGRAWGTGSAFADVDGDGDLDLYVANYVDFRFENNPQCGDRAREIWSYCRPSAFKGQRDYLYINDGTGHFSEQGAERGIVDGLEDRGFGVIFSDIDMDGDQDLLVANDGTQNRFYINDGMGFFNEVAAFAGLGYNRDGAAEAGMGMTLGDVNGDLKPDLFVTNYSFETNTLYIQTSPKTFEDLTPNSGLEEASFLPVGWGTQLMDINNDGHLDLAVANGHVLDNAEQFDAGIGYRQPDHLFLGDGNGRFKDVTSQAGDGFLTPSVSRGLAVADWNSDGALDILITRTNDQPALLENMVLNRGQWLGINLKGKAENRFAIGARVIIFEKGEPFSMREVRSGSGFLSQDDLRLHFGLGNRPGPFRLDITWPDGHTQQSAISDWNRYIQIDYTTPSSQENDQ